MPSSPPGLLKRQSLRRKKSKPSASDRYSESDQPTTKQFKGSNNTMKRCYHILSQLKRHPCAEPFLRPVDAVALNLPDYHDIVKEPMDLNTVERNLRSGL